MLKLFSGNLSCLPPLVSYRIWEIVLQCLPLSSDRFELHLYYKIATHSSSTNERYVGYEHLVRSAVEAGASRLIGVGGAGQLLMEDGQIKQTDPSWFPALASVTEDHQRGLATVRKSTLNWTWVAPPYMPTDAASSGGYIATNGVWNNTGMLPQVDVAQFIVDETFEPKHLGHVVGLSARQPN